MTSATTPTPHDDYDDDEGGRASTGSLQGLSRISCNTKYAIALNQIDRIEINSTYEREEDGVTVYVLDVYLWCVQTGIPTSSRPKSAHHYDYTAHEVVDPILQKREQEKKPHYRMAYRYSDFYRLRKELQAVVGALGDPEHTEGCVYCGNINWLAHMTAFPSRCLVDSMLVKIPWLRQLQVKHRQRELSYFLDVIIRTANNMREGIQDEPCDGFINVSYILKEFLTEPHVRLSCTGW